MEQSHVVSETWLQAMSMVDGKRLETEAAREGPIEIIRRGFRVRDVSDFARRAQLPQKYLLDVMQVPRSTFSRKVREDASLTAQASDRLFRVARVIVRAAEVFEDQDVALDWLSTPNKALGDDRPYDLLDTDAGAEAVEDVLGRIEHGVYS